METKIEINNCWNSLVRNCGKQGLGSMQVEWLIEGRVESLVVQTTPAYYKLLLLYRKV
jgi:hypothetical protein